MTFIIVKLLSVGLMIFTIAIFSSCKKEGLGGKGEIKGYATLNGKTLKPFTFYINYGSTSFPGSDISKYNDSNLSDGDGKFNFKGLRKGDYYIYAVGTDNGISVSGSIHIILANDEIKDNVVIVVNP